MKKTISLLAIVLALCATLSGFVIAAPTTTEPTTLPLSSRGPYLYGSVAVVAEETLAGDLRLNLSIKKAMLGTWFFQCDALALRLHVREVNGNYILSNYNGTTNAYEQKNLVGFSGNDILILTIPADLGRVIIKNKSTNAEALRFDYRFDQRSVGRLQKGDTLAFTIYDQDRAISAAVVTSEQVGQTDTTFAADTTESVPQTAIGGTSAATASAIITTVAVIPAATTRSTLYATLSRLWRDEMFSIGLLVGVLVGLILSIGIYILLASARRKRGKQEQEPTAIDLLSEPIAPPPPPIAPPAPPIPPETPIVPVVPTGTAAAGVFKVPPLPRSEDEIVLSALAGNTDDRKRIAEEGILVAVDATCTNPAKPLRFFTQAQNHYVVWNGKLYINPNRYPQFLNTSRWSSQRLEHAFHIQRKGPKSEKIIAINGARVAETEKGVFTLIPGGEGLISLE